MWNELGGGDWQLCQQSGVQMYEGRQIHKISTKMIFVQFTQHKGTKSLHKVYEDLDLCGTKIWSYDYWDAPTEY